MANGNARDLLFACLSFFQYLADVEGHLGESISIIQPSMRVPVNEFDGKVTYGEKRRGSGQCLIG